MSVLSRMAVAFTVAGCVACASAQSGTLAITAVTSGISAERMKAEVRFVSDDVFEGRYPGKRGGELAAKYMATQFELDGLKPAGDNGTYFQNVHFVGMTARPAEVSFALETKSGPMMLKFGDDFTVSNQTLTPVVNIDAPIVWVGYGATAPEYQWNDYAGVDVKGKVILCIVGDPPSHDPKFFMGDALTYYGRWTYKFEQAARMGAVGALIIHRTDLASYNWDVVRHSNTGEKTYLRDDANPRLQGASWIQLDVARKIFEASGMTLDGAFDAAGKRGFHAIELPVRVKEHVASDVRAYDSPNVVGILPGANPGGKDQAVFYTAHYDHFGIVEGMKGDNIYNGAADNGSGLGILLELAHAWGTAHVTLPHSIVFSAVTAEEQGLLGSEYLGQHPPVPAAQIALDINYDMLLPIGMQKEIDVNGAQRTDLYPVVAATAKQYGLTIVPDPQPSHGSYYRSDHFSMSREGIPAFSVDAGTLYEGHDAAWGLAQKDDYDAHHYHDFSDNFDPHWDFRGNANLARFGAELGWNVLNAAHTVHWLPGDEFEPARKASEAR